MDHLSERLVEILKDQGITQKELGDKIGLQQSTVSMFINRGKISLENLVKIAEIFNTSLDWLVMGRGSKYLNTITYIEHQPQNTEAKFTRFDIDSIVKDKDLTIEILRNSLAECNSDKETYKNLYIQAKSS